MTRPLVALIDGYRYTQILSALARLSVLDRLFDGPLLIEDLVSMVDGDPQMVRRLIQASIAIGLTDVHDSAISVTDLGRDLCGQAHHSLKNYASLCGEQWWWQGMGTLYETIIHGESGFERHHGLPLFDLLQKDPDLSRQFGAISTGGAEATAAAAVLDLRNVQSIVDLGGGSPRTLEVFSCFAPAASLHLIDLPHVIHSIRMNYEEKLQRKNITLCSGDLISGDGLISDKDLYILKYVCIDWPDATVIKILSSITKQMGSNSQLLVIEQIIVDVRKNKSAVVLDIGMMVLCNGRCRTLEEWHRLAELAGLEVVSLKETRGPASVLTLKKTQCINC